MGLFHDLLSLVYPDICQVCSCSLFRYEHVLCTRCRHHLPRARFAADRDNPAARVFWGRVPLQMVITAYHYNKGNAVQQLIHRFKYRGMKDIGVFLGEQLGKEIIRSGHADDIDLILPVPLHPKKKKKRGFNQSEIIAVGMASVTGKELNAKCLYRRTYSDTQTRKTKYERWENVEKIFSLRDPEMLSGKHLLLVDDVITTGATLEACAQVLMKTEGIRISVAAVAFTRG